MPSRRKRKRQRRNAEATANCPETRGGWGQGLPTTLSDLVLLRRAINEDWPVPANVQRAIVGELETEINSPDVRRSISVVRTFLAMQDANIRADRIGLAG